MRSLKSTFWVSRKAKTALKVTTSDESESDESDDDEEEERQRMPKNQQEKHQSEAIIRRSTYDVDATAASSPDSSILLPMDQPVHGASAVSTSIVDGVEVSVTDGAAAGWCCVLRRAGDGGGGASSWAGSPSPRR